MTPLPKLRKLADQYGASLCIDDCHATGVLFDIIGTEGALRLPTTYVMINIPSHPNDPIQPVRHIALNELKRPKIDLNQS